MFVGIYWGGVFFSNDGGITWMKSIGLPESRGVSKIIIRADNIVIALVKDQIKTSGYFISHDAGASFKKLNTNLSIWAEQYVDGFVTNANIYSMVIMSINKLKTESDDIIISTSLGLFSFSSAKSKWTKISDIVGQTLLLDHVNKYLIIGTEEGLFKIDVDIVNQIITLNSGWNIISSYVVPYNIDLKVLFQSLIDGGSLKKMMDETGKTIEYFGAFGGWKNNIGNFLTGEGYKINVTANCTLTIPTPVNK